MIWYNLLYYFILIGILFIVLFYFVIDGLYDNSKKYHYNDVQYTKVVKSIHVVNESTNVFGGFEERYYFCFTDGTVKEFDLHSFMNTSEGDTVSWTETVVSYEE